MGVTQPTWVDHRMTDMWLGFVVGAPFWTALGMMIFALLQMAPRD